MVQLPHGWKEGSTIDFHLHWTIPVSGAAGAAENVKWDFTYSMASTGDTFPAESSETITVDVSDIALDTHILTELADIDMTGQTISCMILCSLTRDVSVAGDYTSDAYLTECDFHYRSDQPGSLNQFTK